MTSFTKWLGAGGLGVAAFLSATSNASAAACPAGVGVTTCTANGQTFTLPTDPGVVGGNGNGLTLLADFTTSSQSNSGITGDVIAFLNAYGITNVTYLGRQDGSGTVGGDSITTTGNQSGTWTLSSGSTGDVGAYVAIHAGNGQNDILYKIDSPGLSGTWGTMNGHDLSNFDVRNTGDGDGDAGAGGAGADQPDARRERPCRHRRVRPSASDQELNCLGASHGSTAFAEIRAVR